MQTTNRAGDGMTGMGKGDTANERIRALIASTHGGSVNAAAKNWGIPRSTLRRIVSGESAPKADTLATIARRYRRSGSWLLTGEGDPPDVLGRLPEQLEWEKLVI